MPYLIDGHNLIPKIPGLNLRVIDDEQQLINLLQEFCRQQQKNAEVFFDNAPEGQASKQRFGRVTAQFVRRGTTADFAILNRLGQLKGDARNWVVVSSDHAVQAGAKQMRAHVISSEAFSNQIQAQAHFSPGDKQTRGNPEEDDIDEWLHIFGAE